MNKKRLLFLIFIIVESDGNNITIIPSKNAYINTLQNG